MKTFSYERCQTCIVRACCSNVCEDYRKYAYEQIALTIMSSPITLDRCEEIIKDPPINLGDETFAIIDGVRVISGSVSTRKENNL